MFKSLLSTVFIIFSLQSFAANESPTIHNSAEWSIYEEVDEGALEIQINSTTREDLTAQAAILHPGQYILRARYGESGFKSYIATINERGEIEPQVIAAVTRYILRTAARLLTDKNSWASQALVKYVGKLVGKERAEQVVGVISNTLAKLANNGATAVTKIKEGLAAAIKQIGVPKYVADDVADYVIDAILIAL